MQNNKVFQLRSPGVSNFYHCPTASYSNPERTTTATNGSGSYTWVSSSGYWNSTQGGSSPQPNTSPAPYRTPPHAYPASLEYAPAPPTSTSAPSSAPAPLYPLQYETPAQHHSPYYQHAYAPYAHHAIEDISYWPNRYKSLHFHYS